MSPKWTTAEQEQFLERWYTEYMQVQFQGKRSLFREFWANLKIEWKTTFGWIVVDDVDKEGTPSLEKVSS